MVTPGAEDMYHCYPAWISPQNTYHHYITPQNEVHNANFDTPPQRNILLSKAPLAVSPSSHRQGVPVIERDDTRNGPTTKLMS